LWFGPTEISAGSGSLKHYLLNDSAFPFLTGLWYYLQGQDRPCLTLIGSPNFGYRSVHRDLEAQIAIVTENEELQSQLQEVGSLIPQTTARNDDDG